MAAEQEYLTSLRYLLDLGEDEVIEVERELVLPRCMRGVSAALSDMHLTETE